MEPETREYLDGKWTTCTILPPHGGGSITTVVGSDGDAILTCHCWSAAHFLTPDDVAEYLLEQHGAAERLAAREKDIERAVSLLHQLREYACKFEIRTYVAPAIEALEKPEVTG